MFLARRGKRLERSLHNSLRADVDPRTCGHLPIHHETGAFQFVELLPVRPMAHEIRVRDQDSRRMIVSLEYADRLSRLHQQRLVAPKILQRSDDSAISF